MRRLLVPFSVPSKLEADLALDEAGAGQHALRRDVVVTLAHEIEHGALLRIGRRHRHMPALARDGHRAALSWNQRTHAEAGAGPNEGDGRVAYGRANADLNAIAFTKMRDCERIGGKVVDYAKSLEADVPTEGFNRKRPGMVCECDLVARYRRGNRQYGLS